MATKVFCDRCKKEIIEEDEIGVFLFDNEKSASEDKYEGITVDLCLSCKKELKDQIQKFTGKKLNW